MDDPRAAILEAARELFLEQGFVQTTIQQLADKVGISKGAVYLHFRSKTDVMTSLMRDLEEKVLERVRALTDRADLDPVGRLREQLRLQFTEVREQKLLFEAYVKDSSVAIDEELALFAQKSRVEWELLQEDFVRQAFPQHDERFLTDIAVCLNGALNEYYTYVFLEGAELDPDKVADLLVAQTGALVEALRGDELSPVLDRTGMPGQDEIEQRLREVSAERIEGSLVEIERHAEGLEGHDQREITETIDALRHALAQESPSRVVLQGLVANLREWKALSGARKSLAYELGLKLV